MRRGAAPLAARAEAGAGAAAEEEEESSRRRGAAGGEEPAEEKSSVQPAAGARSAVPGEAAAPAPRSLAEAERMRMASGSFFCLLATISIVT